VGELNPGWRRMTFAELAECVNDRVDDPAQAGVSRYVGLEHLDPQSLVIRRWGTPDQVESTKLRFRAGDIIFGKRRAYQRKLAVADFEGICSAHAMVLRAKPGAVLREFLPFFMQSDTFMDRAQAISVGSLSPTINWKTLAAEEFALPPLEEQRRLVGILRAIRVACDAIAHAIDGADQARRAILLHWFRADRGKADTYRQHWKATTVRDVGDTQVGIRKHPGSLKGPNMQSYLRVANVLDGRIDWSEIMKIDVPPAERCRCALQDGDILVNKGNSMNLVGRAAIYRGSRHCPCYFQDYLLRFRAGSEIVPEFAHAYF
jgi:type I restriction enzyme, S subunit